MSAPKITPLADGPLLVTGLDDLRTPNGPLDAGDSYALCRCGASRNKPFCDGNHKPAKFTSAKHPERTPDQRDEYAGKDITIHDNRGLCAHAGVCTERLPSVWRMQQEPWIDPDGAPAGNVAAVIRACPSGALTYSDHATPEEAPESPAIVVASNGPYVLTGACELVGEKRTARATLCRCGASKNKPFCDGTHWAVEFKG